MRARNLEVKKNLIDRAVEFFDPVRGRNRYKARVQLALAGQWVGGRKDRQGTKDWNPPGGSADEDNLYDLPEMRSRTRDLQRRSAVALGATNTNVSSVVGTGLSLRAIPDALTLGISPQAAATWRQGTERKFRAWADNAIACDLEATLDFYQQQALAFRSAYDSGDVIALLPYKERKASKYKLKVQLVEADRLCNRDGKQDDAQLTSGVAKDSDGAPSAYHIARFHPGAMNVGGEKEWDVVPAFGARTGRRNVVHLFDKRRPGQTRGVPYLAPVIEILKQISDYTHAELNAAVVAAAFTVFIESPTGSGLDLDGEGEPQTVQGKSGSDVKMGSGAIIDLAKGEKVSFADPGRPNAAADVFLTAMMRQLGVALELPYEILVKHFTASYSAARAALLEAWRFFKGRRAWLASMFCQPIYEAWLEEAISIGDVIAPGFFDDPLLRAAWAGAEWVGDAPGQIDPLKEIEAAIKRIDATVSDRTTETLELRGGDWFDVVERLSMEQKLIDERQIRPLTPPAGGGASAPPKKVFPSDDLGKDEEQEEAA